MSKDLFLGSLLDKKPVCIPITTLLFSLKKTLDNTAAEKLRLK